MIDVADLRSTSTEHLRLEGLQNPGDSIEAMPHVDEDSILCCPICGYDYVSEDPGPHTDETRLYFKCEAYHRFSVAFAFHKGRTFITTTRLHNTPQTTAEWEGEIENSVVPGTEFVPYALVQKLLDDMRTIEQNVKFLQRET